MFYGIGPADLQHVIGKSYMAEKVQDVQDKAAMNRQDVVVQEQKEDQEKRSETVAESETSEGKTVDTKEEKRKKEQERKKRERQKEIAKRLSRDSGHIIDLEA